MATSKTRNRKPLTQHTMEETIVRQNLLKYKNYRPYCGSDKSCSMPRTEYRTIDSQFICPECKWISSFPAEFIEKYKQTHFKMEETKQTETMDKTVIHCKTKSEFNRIMKMYNMDDEYLNWDVYENDTVLYPFTNEYGHINGYAKEANYKIIESENL